MNNKLTEAIVNLNTLNVTIVFIPSENRKTLIRLVDSFNREAQFEVTYEMLYDIDQTHLAAMISKTYKQMLDLKV